MFFAYSLVNNKVCVYKIVKVVEMEIYPLSYCEP